MISVFAGVIALLVFVIFKDPKDPGFLVAKRYGMLFAGVGLIIGGIAIEILGIGVWFLAISIPGSLAFTVWYYFRERKEMNDNN